MTIPASYLPRVPSERKQREPGKKMQTVVKLMVHEGLDMAQAAARAGSTTRAVRKAFESPSAVHYLAKIRKTAQIQAWGRNVHRLEAAASQTDNIAAGVAAMRMIEEQGQEFVSGSKRQSQPGLVINILAQDGSTQTVVSGSPSPIKPQLGRPPGDDHMGFVEPSLHDAAPNFSDPDDPPDAA